MGYIPQLRLQSKLSASWKTCKEKSWYIVLLPMFENNYFDFISVQDGNSGGSTYSDYNNLEEENEHLAAGLSGKVKALKSVGNRPM